MSSENFEKHFVDNYLERETAAKLFLSDGSRIDKTAYSLRVWALKEKLCLNSTGNKELNSEVEDSPTLATFFKDALKGILKLSKEKHNKEKAEANPEAAEAIDLLKERSKETTQLNLREYVPVLDIESNNDSDRYKMIHSATNQFIPNLTFSSWKERFDNDIVNQIKKSTQPAIFRYNPQEVSSKFVGEFAHLRTGVVAMTEAYNTYTRPLWRNHPVKNPQCPEEIKLFFEHMFPDPNCRRYMFEKIHQILHDRLEVFLVINGGTGIGKGLLTENLMRFGVGDENFVIAPESWDKSNFNAWLKNKQVVLMDEVPVNIHNNGNNYENVNRLKRFINDRQAIEEKGKDPKMAIRSFASFFITSNNGTKNFKLELDNRRFSVLDVTEDKIKESFDEETFNKITHCITQDDEKRGEFFWWILKTFPLHKQKYPDVFMLWKGPTYWRFRKESLSKWERYVVEVCTGKEAPVQLEYVELVRRFADYCEENGLDTSKFTVKAETISAFLQNYRHHDEDPIGEIKAINGKNFLVVAEKFVSKKAKIKAEGEYEDALDL